MPSVRAANEDNEGLIHVVDWPLTSSVSSEGAITSAGSPGDHISCSQEEPPAVDQETASLSTDNNEESTFYTTVPWSVSCHLDSNSSSTSEPLPPSGHVSSLEAMDDVDDAASFFTALSSTHSEQGYGSNNRQSDRVGAVRGRKPRDIELDKEQGMERPQRTKGDFVGLVDPAAGAANADAQGMDTFQIKEKPAKKRSSGETLVVESDAPLDLFSLKQSIVQPLAMIEGQAECGNANGYGGNKHDTNQSQSQIQRVHSELGLGSPMENQAIGNVDGDDDIDMEHQDYALGDTIPTDVSRDGSTSTNPRSIFGFYWDREQSRCSSYNEQDGNKEEQADGFENLIVEFEKQDKEEEEEEQERRDELPEEIPSGQFRPIFGNTLKRRTLFRSPASQESLLSATTPSRQNSSSRDFVDDEDDPGSETASASAGSAPRRSIFATHCFAQPNATAPPVFPKVASSSSLASSTCSNKKKSSLRPCRYSGDFRRMTPAHGDDTAESTNMKRSVSFNALVEIEVYEKDMEQYATSGWLDWFNS